jgi:short-subunit dehydrogenase
MKKIWLIGASEGIGRALAMELSKDNLLILSARNKERLEDLSPYRCFPLDVMDENITLPERVDTVIYCTGYYKPMSSKEIDLSEALKMIDVNFTGAVKVLNAVIPDFIAKKQGHIVLIGSIAGYTGLPNSFGYGASKAALIHLAENLKCDLSKYNIKVQVINPGFVKTRLTDLNNFSMPSIMTPEMAAKKIVKYMNTGKFDSRFPFWFGNLVRCLKYLPYWLYFKLLGGR